MKKITPKLKELVKQEAKNLRKYATKPELNKLDINTFSPLSQINCVYGQMTGICSSLRATELITKCAVKIFNPGSDDAGWLEGSKIGGKPTGEGRNSDKLEYFSPIEVFIFLANRHDKTKNSKLISYLKGETKTLKL